MRLRPFHLCFPECRTTRGCVLRRGRPVQLLWSAHRLTTGRRPALRRRAAGLFCRGEQRAEAPGGRNSIAFRPPDGARLPTGEGALVESWEIVLETLVSSLVAQ